MSLSEHDVAPGLATSGWQIRRVDKGRPFQRTISHGFVAVAPGCPNGRHPTRDCGCRVFKTDAEAAAYVTEQEDH